MIQRLGQETLLIVLNLRIASTNIVTNGDKKKYVYSGYGITFDGACLQSFDNDTAINVIIFGNDDSLLPHSDNRKNKFVVLGEGRSFELMEALVHQRRS